MSVLAIDPGPERSAYAAWDGSRVTHSGMCANGELREIVARLEQRRPKQTPGDPTHLAVEHSKSYLVPRKSGAPFFPQQVLDTALEAGRFIEAWDGPHSLVDRRAVKLYLVGRASCGDAEIRAALLDQIGPRGTKANPGPLYGVTRDRLAALAVAVTWWDTVRPELELGCGQNVASDERKGG